MSILNELKTFLDLLGTLGTLTIGTMPASPDVVGTLYEYGGQKPDKGFGISGIQYEIPSVQLVFRGLPNEYLAPRTKAYTAWNALAAIQPGALCTGVTTEYLLVDPQQSPFAMAKDSNDRIHIACNYYIKKVPS